MVQFEAWHGKTLAEHEALRNQWAADRLCHRKRLRVFRDGIGLVCDGRYERLQDLIGFVGLLGR